MPSFVNIDCPPEKTSGSRIGSPDLSAPSSKRQKTMVATENDKRCAAGDLCRCPDPNPNEALASSTHHCFSCSQRMHCALWCGENWLTIVATTNITLGSLTAAGREKVANGDHETLAMCHTCINKLLQAPLPLTQIPSRTPSLPTLVPKPTPASQIPPPITENESSIASSLLKKEWKFVTPKPSKSQYWQFFLKFDPQHHKGMEERAVCKLCLDTGTHYEVGTKDANTSGLISHIKSTHVKVYDDMQTMDSSTMDAKTTRASANGIAKYLMPKRKSEIVKHLYTRAATACIIDNAFPLSIVASESFRKMFVPLNCDASKIVNISSRSIRTEILKLGRMAQRATAMELTGRQFTYTLDHWTGPNSWTYGGATAHYIDDISWEMCSALLDFKLFEGRTTGALIFEDISSVLSKFNNKLNSAVVLHAIDDGNDSVAANTTTPSDIIGITDTTGNMGKLGEYLRENGQEHAYCFAHVLHLVAGKAFDPKDNLPIKEVMRKLRSVVGYFNLSTQATSKLINFQARSEIEEYSKSKPKKLIQDVITRWWSTYQSIERALYLQKAIKGLLATNEVQCEEISKREWEMLGEIECVLKPLAFFQRVLEGEGYVTGSLVPLAVYNIRRQLLETANDPATSDGVQKLANDLLSDFDTRYTPNKDDDTLLSFSWGACLGFRKRYTTVHHYFFASAFLDPRAKTLLKSFMTEADWKVLKEKIFDLMVEGEENTVSEDGTEVSAHDSFTFTNSKRQGETPTLSSAMTNATPKNAKAVNVSNMFHVGAVKKAVANAAVANPQSLRNRCAQQLNAFVDDGVWIPLNDDDGSFINPLHWWKENAAMYPAIAKLAQKFLAIPATSAPTERVFSRAGRMLSLKRASLKPELAQRMMFIKENAALLGKHYEAVALQESDTSKHPLINEEKKLLPSAKDILKVVSENTNSVTDRVVEIDEDECDNNEEIEAEIDEY